MSSIRIVVCSSLVVATLLSAFALHEWIARPLFPRILFERIFFRYLFDQPELLTLTGILRPTGLRFFQSRLSDISDEADTVTYNRLKRDLSQLKDYSEQSLSPSQRKSRDILQYFLESTIRLNDFHELEYIANPITGHYSTTFDLLTLYQPLENTDDVQDYLQRLQRFSAKIDVLRTLVEQRAQHSIIMPSHPLQKSVALLANMASDLGRNNALCQSLDKAKTHISAAALESAKDSCAKIVDESVIVSLTELKKSLENQLRQSEATPGIWHQPHGDQYYKALVRYHTSTEHGPEYWHAQGLADVARIQKAIIDLLTSSGHLQHDATFADAKMYMQMSTEHFDDSDAGRNALLSYFQEIIDSQSKGISSLLKGVEVPPVVVKPIDARKSASSPLAHYVPGSFDGRRAGAFFVNTGNLHSLPLHQLKTLAYHETVPGHHLQISIQQSIRGTPTFRRAIPFTGYQEGWALYAEWLAFHHDNSGDVMSHVGQLEYELLRSVRLVVDTGIHYVRWTRDDAINYFVENAGRSYIDAESEVDRYSVLPGQALAYKAGMMTLIALRSEAEAALGTSWDESAFHHVILDDGPRPLSMVEEDVRAWYRAQTQNPP